MGIFSIFSKNNTGKEKQKNELLVDFKNINLQELLADSFNISEREIEGTDGIILTDWEAYLEKTVLGIFDTVQITLKGKEKEIRENDSIQVAFFKRQPTTMQQNEYIVNSAAKICSIQNDNWTDTDKMRINSGVWRGRMFQHGDTTFYIDLNPINGITLTISAFNNFQRKI
jgi:hypothetical protein